MKRKRLDGAQFKNVKTIIAHENCPDGIVSALVLVDRLPQAEVRFVQYGQPSREKLRAAPGMLFCDMTPPRERAQEFVDAGAIVLDHHEKQKDIVEMFGDNGVYTDVPGISGAALAYVNVWLTIPGTKRDHLALSKLATLVGVRDTWDRESRYWYEAQALSTAIMFHWPGLTLSSLIDISESQDKHVGHVLYEKRLAKAKRIAEHNGHLLEVRDGFRPWRALVFESTGDGIISEVADYARQWHRPPSLDFCASFRMISTNNGPAWKFSLRSVADVDVGALAALLGGGGHVKAAGFTSEDLSDPLQTAHEALETLMLASQE